MFAKTIGAPAPLPDPELVVPAVAARDLTRDYGSGESVVHALRGVSLEVPAGQFTAVMGPSGSGKSTLMHLLAGLDTPTAGSVRVSGRELADMGDDELTLLRRDRIGFVFQAFNLLPMLSVEENILLPARIAGAKPDPALVESVIEGLGLAERRRHLPAELSGGQQQRVAIARAIVGRPAVLFADEPTGNLDSATGAEILGVLREAVDSHGQTTVMVTHDAHAAAVADRVVFLADGQIVDDLSGAPRTDPRRHQSGGAMTRVAIKALAQRKLRTALTVLAIVVGVGMVSAALVLGDSMRKGADSLSASSYRGTDAVVSARTPFTVSSQQAGATPTIPASVLERVRAVPGRRRRRRRHHRPAGQAGGPATASPSATARTSASATTPAPRAPPA